MSDFISRADAIIAIKSLYPQMPVLRILHDRWMEENKPYMECERAIRNLPPAESCPYDRLMPTDFLTGDRTQIERKGGGSDGT